MAVSLRLRRVGRKKLPIYKVVAADRRSPRDGRYIEAVGQYEPLRPSNNVEFNEERVLYWLQTGAQPTDTVRTLLRKNGLWLKWSLIKKGADENTINEQVEKYAELRAEKEKEKLELSSRKKQVKQADKSESDQAGEPESGKEEVVTEDLETAPETEEAKNQDQSPEEKSPEQDTVEQNDDTEKKD